MTNAWTLEQILTTVGLVAMYALPEYASTLSALCPAARDRPATALAAAVRTASASRPPTAQVSAAPASPASLWLIAPRPATASRAWFAPRAHVAGGTSASRAVEFLCLDGSWRIVVMLAYCTQMAGRGSKFFCEKRGGKRLPIFASFCHCYKWRKIHLLVYPVVQIKLVTAYAI